MKPEASSYVFPDAKDWDDVTEVVKPGDEDEEPFEEFQPEEAEATAGQDEDFTGFHEYNGFGGEEPPDEAEPPPPPALAGEEAADAVAADGGAESAPPRKRRSTPVDYARIQAEAILSQAREEADAMKEAALAQAQEELQQLRREARSDGYNAGYAEGMASGMSEGREERERQAMEQGKVIKEFLEAAVKQRDQLLDETREELRDLALAIAEKVIRISLKSSGDVLMRMIETATEKHRRCEWVQIYIADCDAKNLALSMPGLTAALGHLSDRVRIIPMADDESGTCIIEMPDEIIDASVSTQMDNIREVMSTAVRE